MHLSLDTNDLSELDIAILRALAGVPVPTPGQSSSPEVSSPAPARAAKLAAVPEPDPAADLFAGTDAAPVYTMKDAVAEATKVVNSGKTSEVKDVLTSLGVERISELTPDNIGEFVEAVKAL